MVDRGGNSNPDYQRFRASALPLARRCCRPSAEMSERAREERKKKEGKEKQDFISSQFTKGRKEQGKQVSNNKFLFIPPFLFFFSLRK